MSKVVIVTGASRGIGYETSLALADWGHQVIALARTREKLLKLEARYPSNIRSFQVDLTVETEILQFVSQLSDSYGQVDILINNAGYLINKPFESLTLEEWRSLLEGNLISNVLLTKAMLPHLRTSAHILNISSMGGFQGSFKFPGLTGYSVAKGAVSILSECLAVELASKDIKVNALCLGAVQTEMLDQAFPGFKAPVSASQMGGYVAEFALKGSTFYNGQILPVTLSDPD